MQGSTMENLWNKTETHKHEQYILPKQSNKDKDKR